ncbi:MAG: aminotransferase class I/II-fold pyridoxal phosphate-dependent enzyme [Longimicrobiales bacterium]|nr:aminotransferase class I/II-fold pyridoxal phosphate-dependent enzyme [Longimicrobiales bacterium]
MQRHPPASRLRSHRPATQHHPQEAPLDPLRPARRTATFTESVIREMTRVARELGALNLAQGFPDFPAPDRLKEAAAAAIRADVNQYAITWGAPALRRALVESYRSLYGMEVDGEREVTVTCGATEAMAAVFLALLDPGDEVLVPEPFYENYGPDAVLCGARPVYVPLDPPDYRLDPERLAAALTPRTRAVVLNTPNNPTGRVFSRAELEAAADLCRTHGLMAVTDEIYEHIVYEGSHTPLATLDGMRERTVTVSGASKTFSVTGWRVGTIVAPPALTDAIRKVHDFLTVGAPAPLQEAVATGLRELGTKYYAELAAGYRLRRDTLVPALQEAGFGCRAPEGAYYVLADFSALGREDDVAFSHRLAREAGVVPVPGSSFFSEPARGFGLVRFAFCKRQETLEEAADRLRRFAAAGGR